VYLYKLSHRKIVMFSCERVFPHFYLKGVVKLGVAEIPVAIDTTLLRVLSYKPLRLLSVRRSVTPDPPEKCRASLGAGTPVDPLQDAEEVVSALAESYSASLEALREKAGMYAEYAEKSARSRILRFFLLPAPRDPLTQDPATADPKFSLALLAYSLAKELLHADNPSRLARAQLHVERAFCHLYKYVLGGGKVAVVDLASSSEDRLYTALANTDKGYRGFVERVLLKPCLQKEQFRPEPPERGGD